MNRQNRHKIIITAIHGVRCSDCTDLSLGVSCSDCSVFEIFTGIELFGQDELLGRNRSNVGKANTDGDSYVGDIVMLVTL